MPDFVFDTENPTESLDGVPQNFHHMFEEGDNGFVLGETHRGVAEVINGLTANLNNSRKTKKSVSDEAAARRQQNTVFENSLRSAGYEGEEFDEENVTAFITGLTQKAGAAGDVGERLAAQKAEMTRAHTSALEAKDTEIGGMQKSLEKYLINSEASNAIAAEKGNPALLTRFVQDFTKVQKLDNGDYVARVVDADGEIRYNGKGDPMTVAELVRSMKEDKTYGVMFEAEVTPGGGTQHSPKPVAKGNSKMADGDKSPVSKIASGLTGLKGRGRR